jgi:hypothetical protein
VITATANQDFTMSIFIGFAFLRLSNVKSEPRAWLAHFVLLGARNVTAMLVGSTAWLGSVLFED